MVKSASTKLVREIVGEESYEYYPLGQYIVAAPGMCGGRPTFKYTRIDVRHALGLLAAGCTVEQVAHSWKRDENYATIRSRGSGRWCSPCASEMAGRPASGGSQEGSHAD